jgi:Protein of unknown function (DUF2630)
MMVSRDVADTDIFEYVNALSSEEERLYQKAGDGSGLSDGERDRLQAIKVELDRCYDLLHQRQGRRDAGQDPSDATLRTARTVEGYEQ